MIFEGDMVLMGHGSSCPGYRSTVMLDQKSGLAAVVFVNAAGVSPEKLAMGVFKAINRYESTPRSANAPGNLADYTGRYDTMVWGNETLMAP